MRSVPPLNRGGRSSPYPRSGAVNLRECGHSEHDCARAATVAEGLTSLGVTPGLTVAGAARTHERMGRLRLLALILGSLSAAACSRPTETAPPDALPPAPPSSLHASRATPQSVVAGLVPYFRKCRRDHLGEVPDMAGTVELLLTFDNAGNVVDASGTPTGTVSPAVASCVSSRVREEKFPPPTASRSLKMTINIADDEDDEATVERANARRVTEAMKGDFEQCYADALESHPDASGRVVLEVTLTESGKPEGGRVASRSGNLPPDVDECVLRRLAAAKFAPPRDGQVVVRVPIVLKRDDSP
jgi:TonB family protein